MGELNCILFDNITRKKRSHSSRRPQSNFYRVFEIYDRSPFSSSPHSNDFHKLSSDENTGCDVSLKMNEFNLNQCISKGNEHGRNGLNIKRYSDDVETAEWRSKVNGETQISGHDNKVRKVRLKVGGVTRTIHGNSAPKNMLEDGVAPSRSFGLSDAIQPQERLILQGSLDDDVPPSAKRRSLQGKWKDSSGSGFNLSRGDSSVGKSDPARKSKRVPKKKHFDDDDDDEEIRYMEKLKTFKVHASSRVSKYGKVDEIMENSGSSRSDKDRKKAMSNRASADTDYQNEVEPLSDGDFEVRKKPRKESIDLLMDSKREITLTTRQRALHLGKDTSCAPGASLEFPNGLPPAPSRKQKDKLTEVEQQVKKAEAAQRRRVQNEKAARESEAEAIRKILGQDSNRKKKEDKIKKRQEELAQERAANALTVAPNTVRWVMGPTGTIVTFSNDLGLPSLFNSKPISYPPPREKCAGPSCTNTYRYRDSRSKLPLCSLKCYKAVQGRMQDPTTAIC